MAAGQSDAPWEGWSGLDEPADAEMFGGPVAVENGAVSASASSVAASLPGQSASLGRVPTASILVALQFGKGNGQSDQVFGFGSFWRRYSSAAEVAHENAKTPDNFLSR